MARKRGGIAGLWDRNKGIIKPLASGVAGVLGTPMLGAAVGAAMGGLDREGKGGIGFDARQGALGGLKGYGAGKLASGAVGGFQAAGGAAEGGNALLGGLKGAMGLGGSGSTPDLAPMDWKAKVGMGGRLLSPEAAAASATPGAGGVMGGIGGWLKKGQNMKALGDAAQAGAGMYQNNQYYGLQRRQYEVAEEERRRQREREEGADPHRAAIMQALMQRMGLGGAA